MQDSDEVFRAVCFQMVEDGELDEELAQKVVDTHYDHRVPVGEEEQVLEATAKVAETVRYMTDAEKRRAVKAQYDRDMQAFRDFGKELVGAMAASTDEANDVPDAVRKTAAEANELFTGQKQLSETKIGFVLAFITSFSLLDIIFLPAGMYYAYKIAAGKD
jgi:hypothetical protein